MVLGSDLRRDDAGRGGGPAAVGPRAAPAAALVLLLAVALGGCGDDSGGGSDGAPPTPSVENTTTAAPSPAATAPADPAAATAQIRENWRRFFDPATSTKDKQAVLENGDRMALVLRAFGGDRRGGQVQATVTKTEFTSPTAANVTYTLTLKGATALPDARGTAVEQNGTWKVSDRTLCALVQLSGNASASALPGC
ncbi:hypothetical protein ACH4UM_11745 [Streptomyces sp. NPDC020801]|uniref:hypothetical protein n=1 Tax=unclassified Streptomyces TaxID=2593676 RepID=UPI00379B491C